jgi:hypothetical protein
LVDACCAPSKTPAAEKLASPLTREQAPVSGADVDVRSSIGVDIPQK